jgi:predicted glycosyltransferase
MSDQPFRAERFERLGLARTVREASAEACAAAIPQALADPPPVHDLALDGAVQTRALLEAL